MSETIGFNTLVCELCAIFGQEEEPTWWQGLELAKECVKERDALRSNLKIAIGALEQAKLMTISTDADTHFMITKALQQIQESEK